MADDEIEEPLPYAFPDDLDFSLITMGVRSLPFFKDDLYLGMQAMNVGIVDAVITGQEYELLREYRERERTPVDTALAVSALSQMWIYGLYEVLRLWRDRKFEFERLLATGGMPLKLEHMSSEAPDMNLTLEARKRQMQRFANESAFRDQVAAAWVAIEGVYRVTELFRMNLAKHCAPGKNGAIPRAPGYGRINGWCGAMDFELIQKDGYYTTLNRRDIADGLRAAILSLRARP